MQQGWLWWIVGDSLSAFSKCLLYRKQSGRYFLRVSVAAAAATITPRRN